MQFSFLKRKQMPEPSKTCYIVTFETLTDASRDKVVEILKSYGNYCPIHKYCWAILSDKKSLDICNHVRSVMQPTERIFVIRSGTAAAWWHTYAEENSKWLKENL